MTGGLLGLALGAGMVAAVNPCGFALLPAYLSLLVVGDHASGRTRAVGRALRLTLAMTVGFAAVFAVFGLVIAPVASGLQRHLPWFTVGLGLGLAALGVAMVLGRELDLSRLRRGSTRARPLTGGFGSMAGFGAGYALASLTCTIAPFLAVVVAGFRGESALVGTGLLLAYAAGMGLVVGTAAVAVALAHGTVVRTMRGAGRWVPRAGGALLVLAGAYVAYYGWWELRVLDGASAADPVIATAARVQRALVEGVRFLGALGWLVLGVALVALAFVGVRRVRGRSAGVA